MDLIEWRRQGDRLAMAGRIITDPVMQEMLSVLETEEHPARSTKHVADGFGATMALGEIRGYQRCLSDLRSFMEPLPQAPEDIPITWNAETKD